MATTTTTPTVSNTPSVETRPVNFTPNAINKVKEIMAQQNPVPAGLRVESWAAAAPDSPIRCRSRMALE